jgi:hypothetical protein
MSRADSLPYQFLLKASVPTLESFELSRLNHAANLKKQISDLIDQYLDESTAALLARAMILRMNRARPHSVDRKRQLAAPRSIASQRVLASARSITPSRAIPSSRALPRSKPAIEVQIQRGMSFDLFAKSHAR